RRSTNVLDQWYGRGSNRDAADTVFFVEVRPMDALTTPARIKATNSCTVSIDDQNAIVDGGIRPESRLTSNGSGSGRPRCGDKVVHGAQGKATQRSCLTERE